jgi:hypothetical protein
MSAILDLGTNCHNSCRKINDYHLLLENEWHALNLNLNIYVTEEENKYVWYNILKQNDTRHTVFSELVIMLYQEFEDTKGVIRILISKKNSIDLILMYL